MLSTWTARLKSRWGKKEGAQESAREEEVFQSETGEDEEEEAEEVVSSKDSWGVSKESRNLLIAIQKKKRKTCAIKSKASWLS